MWMQPFTSVCIPAPGLHQHAAHHHHLFITAGPCRLYIVLLISHLYVNRFPLVKSQNTQLWTNFLLSTASGALILHMRSFALRHFTFPDSKKSKWLLRKWWLKREKVDILQFSYQMKAVFDYTHFSCLVPRCMLLLTYPRRHFFLHSVKGFP